MKGFSLVELILVVALIGIISVAGGPAWTRLLTTTQIEETNAQLVQTLRLARSRSTAGLNQAVHGIYIESNQYTLYQDSSSPYSYATRDPQYDRVTNIDESVSLSSTIVSNDINFNSIGQPNNSGIITITHYASDSLNITINQLGLIESP